MSHVNPEKAVASGGPAKMMDSTMEKMGMSSMMGEGMGSMMKRGMGPMMSEGMGSMMMGGMAPIMKSPGVASGAVVSAGSSAGKSAIKKLFTHPLVLFGLGVIVGCYVYKYRKSIILASDEAKQKE